MNIGKRRSGKPSIVETTVSRRTLIDWFGKATVLALGGEALAACMGRGQNVDAGILADADSAPDARDADGIDTLVDGAYDAAGEADVDLPTDPWAFHPPTSAPEIYSGWPVRTVDRQELESILASWRLTIDGLVENPVTLSFAELLELERQDQVTDFHCVEGWSVFDVPWNGIHLKTLFEKVRPLDKATHVTFWFQDENHLPVTYLVRVAPDPAV